MNTNDLDALDRGTLRLWRALNLIGWGLLGAVVGTVVVGIAVVGVSARSVDAPVGSIEAIVFILALVLGSVGVGYVVGDHVYRWPGWVAGAGVMIPGLLTLLGVPVSSAAEAAYLIGVPGVAAAVAAVVSRRVYRRRPQALQARAG
jgi:hypothetical protein